MADGSRIPRQVLHTSDLHLLSLGDRACHSLVAIVDLAIKTKVDLVIIAGDLFESSSVADNLVSFVVEQLGRLPMPTVILPGNHDCLLPDSVYYREKLWRDVSNVRIFRARQGETFTFPDLGLSVWGKPISSYGGDMRPLAGIPHYQRDGQWHIAAAHGYYDSSEAYPPRSFPISREEIVSSHQDYIALGHGAIFRCVCQAPVKAYYCDSPPVFGAVNIVNLVEGTGVEVERYSL